MCIIYTLIIEQISVKINMIYQNKHPNRAVTSCN